MRVSQSFARGELFLNQNRKIESNKNHRLSIEAFISALFVRLMNEVIDPTAFLLLDHTVD